MKNILIGFLGATCFFLMIGTTTKLSNIGRYQAFGDGASHQLFMIDVETGELCKKRGMNHKKAWKKVSGSDWLNNY